MLPTPQFVDLPKSFWAHVKFVSESLGYSQRGSGALRRYKLDELVSVFSKNGLSTDPLLDRRGQPTNFGSLLLTYLNYRAKILEQKVEPMLMNRVQARKEFKVLRHRLRPKCALPRNKQKGNKRHYAFLTCMVNMLTESVLGAADFDDEPRQLVTVTKNRKLIRTFSRWMDGAYPQTQDPHAIWEVKEYYGTTTFGSRVADAVYETELDGYELAEIRESEKVNIKHYLIVDDHFTWWDCGKSYLCRIIDLLNMGFLDEVIFGREVIKRWPKVVRSWIGK